MVADTCVAMDEWVQNPTAHTALDDILPCVDNATAQETLLQTKDVAYQLVNMVNGVITNISNINYPPNAGPLYFNQSGPLMPVLCNPLKSDLTARQCASGEVVFSNASQVIFIGIIEFSMGWVVTKIICGNLQILATWDKPNPRKITAMSCFSSSHPITI